MNNSKDSSQKYRYKPFYPQKRLDIRVFDLFYALFCSINPFINKKNVIDQLSERWGKSEFHLFTFSVRSGLDLLLTALQLPQESEIIFSGINIPDMELIIRKHHLVLVPLDLNMKELSVKVEELDSLITPRTRLILIAHLHGTICPMEKIVETVSKHGNIFIIEDAAQAFTGISGYAGHPQSHVVMYSFGMIKTCTALFGGVFKIKNKELFEAMSQIQMQWPVVSTLAFLKRILQTFSLLILSNKWMYGFFVQYFKRKGIDHRSIIVKRVRAFKQGEFFNLINRAPSAGLLAFLNKRVKSYKKRNINKRIERYQYFCKQINKGLRAHGIDNPTHSNWIFAVTPFHLSTVVEKVMNLGVDCSDKATQLKVLRGTTENDQVENECKQWMSNVLYIPILEEMPNALLDQIAIILNEDIANLHEKSMTYTKTT